MNKLGKLLFFYRSLSAQLLLLTVVFVMLAEVLIFVPSVAFFRLNYLEKKTDFAHLAALSMLAAPDNMVSEELREELLYRVGARSIVFHGANSKLLMLSEAMPAEVDASYSLSNRNPFILIRDAFASLLSPDGKIIRIITPIKETPSSSLEVVIDEAPLKAAIYTYAWNIFRLSLVISALSAILVYLSLHRLMVRPMGRLSQSMIAFRRAPEDTTKSIKPSGRQDEIGVAEKELEIMQSRVRAALKQKQHLAALGVAVTKINHDLRNILSTSQIVVDGLAELDDPQVQKMAPRLMNSVDRAIELCTRTLKFGKAEEHEPERVLFSLSELVNEVKASIGLPHDSRIEWVHAVSEGFSVYADREQLFRVLLNLGRNAMQALPGVGMIRVAAEKNGDIAEIRVIDNGPGLPSLAREHLFEPFAGSARAGGTGLGLSIAKELMVAHGGSISVEKSDETGTTFLLTLPA